MNFKLSICALLVASLPSSAQIASHASASVQPASAVTTQPTGKPVARVNGVVLTDKDLVREEYLIFPYAKQHDGKIPPEMAPGIRKGALEMIIFEELVYQDAQKKNISVPPTRLNEAEADFRKQFGSPSEYRQFLQSEFQGKDQLLRDKIVRSLLIEQLLKSEVDAKSRVSFVEAKAYYVKNPARFAYPESFAIQTISIMPPANATAAQLKDAKKRADEAYMQAKATKNFEEFGLLAEKISEDDYHVMMGDHKWIARDKMPPEMLQPALKMKDAQISDLLQVGQFYVIFRLNKHVPAGEVPFEQVKVKLRDELQKQKTNEVRASFDKKLRQNAKVETL